MSVWTFVKVLASIAVMGVIAFTGRLAYHVMVRPQGGVFEQVIPDPVSPVKPSSDPVAAPADVKPPGIDPGMKAFERAVEMIAMGQLDEAREKLNTIINVFPTSTSAPAARHMVGEMNLDEILATSNMAGKQTHVVKRGDSFLGIVGKYHTTLDILMHLNGLQELKNLQPGEELVVMPLEFSILIEPQRKAISVWEGGRFICEYPIVRLNPADKLPDQRTTLQAKTGQFVPARPAKRPAKPGTKGSTKPGTKGGSGAADAEPVQDAGPPEKSIQVNKVPLQIRAFTEDDAAARGIFLSPPDLEELFLLTRVGNAVEVRNSAK